MPERSDIDTCDLTPYHKRVNPEVLNIASCMLSILDSLKLYDKGVLVLNGETLSEMMFRKMRGYDVDLNQLLGFDHLKPVTNPPN